jgi:hypothetical protein
MDDDGYDSRFLEQWVSITVILNLNLSANKVVSMADRVRIILGSSLFQISFHQHFT